MGQYAKHMFNFDQELITQKPRNDIFPSRVAVSHVNVIISLIRGSL